MNDWTSQLRKDLQGELDSYGSAGQAIFGSLNPRARNPSPRQQLSQFMNMDTLQRQMMMMEMGPQQYQQHVLDQIDNAVTLLGPRAYQLLPYFMNDVHPNPNIPPPTDMLDSLRGLADANAQDGYPTV